MLKNKWYELNGIRVRSSNLAKMACNHDQVWKTATNAWGANFRCRVCQLAVHARWTPAFTSQLETDQQVRLVKEAVVGIGF